MTPQAEGGAADGAGDRPAATLAVYAYQQEGLVRAAVEAALAQDCEPIEILLSDDASTDGTFAVMQALAAAYDGPHAVRLNRNPRNLGLMGHYRRLWELADGRLILHAAGDDVSEPDRARRALEAWRSGGGRDGEGPVFAVHSSVTRIDAEGASLGLWAPWPEIVEDPSPLRIADLGTNCIGATGAWDRRLAERFGPLPAPCLIEDAALFFRAALLGRIVYLDAPLVRYRVGGLSTMRPVSPGYDHLYGDRMRRNAWRVGNVRAFLQDMEQAEFPEKEACRAVCEEVLDRLGFEADLWAMGPLARLAVLPGALAKSLAARDGRFARQALHHALGPLYVRWFDWRHAPRQG